jgi:hypothetical protein
MNQEVFKGFHFKCLNFTIKINNNKNWTKKQINKID